MKLKLTLIASAAFFALSLDAYAESMSSDTNGVPGGTISTPGSEAKSNPIPPATKSGQMEQGSDTNGVPGGTISTPGSEAKSNPIPPPPPPPQ